MNRCSEAHGQARLPRVLAFCEGETIMCLRSVFPAALSLLCACSTAHALTDAEIEAKIKAAGYSQVRQQPGGKIKTFKAVKDGQERAIIVDSTGHIKELQ
jgi:hypothetical protein